MTGFALGLFLPMAFAVPLVAGPLAALVVAAPARWRIYVASAMSLAAAGWMIFQPTAWMSLLLLLSFFGLGFASLLLYWPLTLPRPDLGKWRILAVLVAAATLGAWVCMIAFFATDRYARHGFVGGLWVDADETVPCAGQMLWLGERAAVIRCEVDQRRVVLTKPEGLELTIEHPDKRPKSQSTG